MFALPAFSRSLSLRLVGSLLLAFVLVWLVLAAKDLHELHDELQNATQLQRFAQASVESLPDDARLARAAVESSARMLAKLQPAQMGSAPTYWLLHDRAGQLIVTFPAPLPPPGKADDLPGYRRTQAQSTQWQLQILAPLPSEQSLFFALAGELLVPLAIAFPLILLPLWLTVRVGLRPLTRFARMIEQRSPDDFSALPALSACQEFEPVSTAYNALQARIRHSIAKERELFQNIAHELRTPLAVLTTQAHVLAHARSQAERSQAHLAMEVAATRAAHLVGQLLTLAAMEDGAGGNPQTVELVGEVQNILIATTPAERQDDLSLIAPEYLRTSIDLAAFHSIVSNLLGNAWKYTQAGTAVTVEVGERGTGCYLCVRDAGEGVPEAEKDKLFGRFYRSRRGLPHEGTGLGLAIVASSAARLGGQARLIAGLSGSGLGVEVAWPRASPAASTVIP